MTDEAKEARRAYHREYKRKWRKANPDKDKEYEERHWEKVAAELKEAERASTQPQEDKPDA